MAAAFAALDTRSFSASNVATTERPSRTAWVFGPGRPLHTAFLDPFALRGHDAGVGFAHLRTAGARFVRVLVNWDQVAPDGPSKPPTFNARDHADPLYRWADTDRQVRSAAAAGVNVIVYVQNAPRWVQSGVRRSDDGPVRPSPSALADFATAAATRYSLRVSGLPRVRYWQIWNEPNLRRYLMPQFANGEAVSPDWYRAMVNAMAQAVHAVHRDNVVVAGGLAPYGGDRDEGSGPNASDSERIRPLLFMRQMLCMSSGANPKPTCDERTEFDVWSHHPYAYGGPRYEAFHPDDVSIGDLGEMRSLLLAASRAGHVKSRGQPGFWVTEFSYDSNPADPKGLPLPLHARYVSEALYRMWVDGVSLVTWFLIRDEPFPGGLFQSGLYFRGQGGIKNDRPKPALRAFRFPFVAFREKGGRIAYWGRTPAGVSKNVVVEQKSGRSWRRVAVPAVDRYGIFSGRVAIRGSGSLRAELVDRSDVSLPFSLTVPKDFRFCPFGTGC